MFTDRPFAGNPLAVFTEAAGLDSATMQVLAREMNLSESAFVLPPTSPETHARIRIFTPTMELPFAGHPTLGTAFVLAEPWTGDSKTDSSVEPVVTEREMRPATAETAISGGARARRRDRRAARPRRR